MANNTGTLSVLSILIRASLVLFALASAAMLAVPIYMAFASASYSAGATMGILAPVVTIASPVLMLAALGSVILVPVWMYRGQANLWAANLSGLTHKPGWSAASWFVPFINLAVPFAAMKQLYNRSLGESEYQEADGISMVVSWWTCSLAWLLVFCVILVITFINLIPGVFVTMPPVGEGGLLVLNSLLQLGSAYYLFRIVAAITRGQEAGMHLAQASTFE